MTPEKHFPIGFVALLIQKLIIATVVNKILMAFLLCYRITFSLHTFRYEEISVKTLSKI